MTCFLPSFRQLAAALALPALVLGTAAPARAQVAATTPADVPASQAAGIIREITEAVGLQPRFELRATTLVDNAAAVVYDGKRFLLYNPKFLAAVNRAGHTDWGGISILAHEMGHHLNGHTLRGGGSQPADELEADEFSGFVLRRLGASLAQAQAALAAVAPAQDTPTHPGRTPRMAAVSQGWNRAQTQVLAANAPGMVQPSAVPAVVLAAPTPVAAAPVATLARSTPGSPERVVGQLTFRANPEVPFYLTSQLNVVRLPDEAAEGEAASDLLAEAQVVGRLRRTGNASFPFVLEDSQQRRLFVTPRGDVYDQQGERVAKMQ